MHIDRYVYFTLLVVVVVVVVVVRVFIFHYQPVHIGTTFHTSTDTGT